jgi:hypothetical protein
MRNFIFCLAASLLLIGCVPKNEKKENKELEAINAKFFDLLSDKNATALDYIFKTNKWLNEDEVKSVKEKLDSLVSQLGGLKGHELIASKAIGGDYLLYSYLVKYERQPLRFILIYYKPAEKWQLQNFQFDYDLEPELKEASSAYRLQYNLPFDETN